MYWKNKGADAEKLLLGVAAYGRTFVLASGLQHGIGHQTLGAGEAGTYTNEDGFLSYFEVKKTKQNKTKQCSCTTFELFLIYYCGSLKNKTAVFCCFSDLFRRF